MNPTLKTAVLLSTLLLSYLAAHQVSGCSDGVLPRVSGQSGNALQHNQFRWFSRAHDVVGTIVLAAGVVALCARKGGSLHKRAGFSYNGAMILLAVTVSPMLAIRPSSIQLMLTAMSVYLCLSGVLALKARSLPTQLGAVAMIGICLAALLPPDRRTGVNSYAMVPAALLASSGLILAGLDLYCSLTGQCLTAFARIYNHVERMIASFVLLLGAGFFNICATFGLLDPAARWVIPSAAGTAITLAASWLFIYAHCRTLPTRQGAD